MATYYNEFNPESAAMIRQFMADGLIPQGDVDTRSITEVSPHDLKGYTQCHFFAGIAGWPFALQLAGWPDDRPVWTGSCPCQPFSAAGRQKGKDDDRHLLPVWLNLIRECRPASLFGEQVAPAVAHGWLDDACDGLEAEGYACGAAILPACSVGAPHKRDRLWFVAHSSIEGLERSTGAGIQGRTSGLAHGCGENNPGSLANSIGERGCGRHGEGGHAADADPAGQAGFWNNARYVACHDGKLRPVEPSICLLAHGVQHRRPILHALGNAIVPPLAAEFIKAAM